MEIMRLHPRPSLALNSPPNPATPPAPSGIGSLIPSRTQEALDIYDAGIKRGDAELRKLGASMLQDIVRGGGSGGDLATELQKLADVSAEVKNIMSGAKHVKLPKYIDMIPTITKYIIKYADKDRAGNLEDFAKFLCKILSAPGQEDRREALLSQRGCDSLFKDSQLIKIVKIFERYPDLRIDGASAIMDVALASKIMTVKEVRGVRDLLDLAPAVDEFKSHFAIQTGPKGKEWFLKFIRHVDELIGKGVRHQIWTVREANRQLEAALNSKNLRRKAIVSQIIAPPKKRTK